MTAAAAASSRTFRVFVSSTFNDFIAERNALQKYVFPRLAEMCAARQGRFQAIDLRWGVSEEAGLDQRAVAICLDEIARCQRTTPRPNFIVLLGDRYGWRPLPSRIEKAEFDAVLAKVPDAGAGSGRALLTSWYRLDENAVPAEYVLKPREVREGEAAEDEATRWANDIEPVMRSALLAAIDALGWKADDPRRAKYVASATEQEIVRGVLETPDAAEHVFAFSRTIDNLPADGAAGAFLDGDQDARDRLVALKSKLVDVLGKSVLPYSATWTAFGITLDHIGSLPEKLADCEKLLDEPDLPHTLCNDVWVSLATIIAAQLDKLETEEPVEAEVAAHKKFGTERCEGFVGRDEPLAAIAKYLYADEHQPLAVIGEPGSGKSALMAKAFERAEADRSSAVKVVRFIGATPGSSDGRTLLGNLCRQITRAYGGDESTVPTEYNDLAVEFGKRLELATADRPLVVFLDALDQLGPTDPARALSWLRSVLPDHVRLVVSSVPGDCEGALKAKRPGPGRIDLDRMTRAEGETALGQWLAGAGRKLRDDQRTEVLDRFAPEGRPLYLKLAFEEARLWRSYDPLAAGMLAAGIPELIRANLFARLADARNHGDVLVSHALGYLAASRYGLSEDELIDVLSADAAVLADFHARSPKSPDVDRLPVVVWSRLYFDLEPYLAEHAGDGVTLLAFYHRQLGEAAGGQFLADEGSARHEALAQYFRGKADPACKQEWDGHSVRGLGELPYHLVGAGTPATLDQLYETLTDFLFLQAKVSEVGVAEHAGADGKPVKTYGGVYLLQDDFALALATMGGGVAGGRKPLIVTAVDFGAGLVVGCPWCTKRSPLEQEWRGAEIACPECQGPLKVNSFVVERSA